MERLRWLPADGLARDVARRLPTRALSTPHRSLTFIALGSLVAAVLPISLHTSLMLVAGCFTLVYVLGTAAATLVAVPRLDIAGARVGPLSVIAHAMPGESLDGLLGRDVLDAFMVTFDAAAGRVTLMPR